jgi:hypothetical protein
MAQTARSIPTASQHSDSQSSLGQAATIGADTPQLGGAVSSLTKLKREMEEIELERNTFKI